MQIRGFRVALFVVVFMCASASASVLLPTSADVLPYVVETPPLEGENPRMIAEFKLILQQFQTLPSNSKRRVEVLRALLERLNKMAPDTPFLAGQRDILRALSRMQLKVPGGESSLYALATNSPLINVRDDAVMVLVEQALRARDQKMLERIYNDTQASLGYPLKSFISLLLRRKEYITEKEATYLINFYLENMVDQFQDSLALSHIIKDLESKIKIEDIDRMMDKFIYTGRASKALPFARFRIEHTTCSADDLKAMGVRFGASESMFASMLKGLGQKNEAVTEYIAFYNERVQARARGSIYNTQLHKYRGITKAPYNLEAAEKAFGEYVDGPVEDRYLNDNAERAVRNYLSFRRFDLILEHLEKAKAQVWEGYYSPYINFWIAYSRLQLGQTNGVSTILSGIISESPDTYFGMMSVELLNRLFKNEPGGAEMKRALFNSLKKNIASKERTTRVNAAVALYYLGNRVERTQAERILSSESLIDNGLGSALTKSGQALTEAYLTLGLHYSARRILHHEGINNPYEQDIIFGDFFEANNMAENGFYPIYSRKQSFAVSGMRHIIGNKALKAYYPRPYFSQVSNALEQVADNLDEHLIYAVMRTESFYKTNARSHAGARGLMQLMPATARQVARQVLENPTNYSLFDPKVNILLGAAYLSDNTKVLGLIPAIAAYNGGPNRVLEVQRKYEPQNIFEFIEVHPIKETRNYMKKVLESYNRYSIIYQGRGLDFSQSRDSLF
ncbi:MAG: lytic transglycosylase domain-containing protein [Brevinema sp.]